MKRISVLGAGTWGIALARMLCNIGHTVTVWSALPAEIEELTRTRQHKNLPYMDIPDELMFTDDVSAACNGADILLFAVPSVFVRSTVRTALPYITESQVIVDVAKGIEPDTLMTMSEIITDELGKAGKKNSVVALSGPTHAEEVAKDMPTTIVAIAHAKRLCV